LKPVLITFSGIDGAGKTTQIEMLRTYLTRAGIPFQQLAFWDDVVLFRSARTAFSRTVLQSDGAVGSPEHPAHRHDKNAQSWALQIGRSILHVLDVWNLRRVVREVRMKGEGVIIFDRYIYDQLAALPVDHWLGRAYARALLGLAPKPDLCYLLDAVPEVARARKPEYPLDFIQKYRNSYLELRKIAELQLIAASDIEDVHLAIVDRFTKAFANVSQQAQIDSAVVA